MTKSECHFKFFAIFEKITTTKSSANFQSPESNEQGFNLNLVSTKYLTFDLMKN